jgi:dTDP-4-dehydrorhamnose 3,5-epimerase
MPFTFTKLAIPEVILIEPQVFGDDRGFFIETFKDSDFKRHGIDCVFKQDNHSLSKKGVLRGLHYQMDPMAQGKLVRVATGKAFDVAVDIRRGSPTYGQWVGEMLSSENHRILWVPPGFAHGVCVLEDDTHLLYRATEEYNPATDRNIRWDDPDLGIKWPINHPDLSEKDAKAPSFKEAENNFEYAIEKRG